MNLKRISVVVLVFILLVLSLRSGRMRAATCVSLNRKPVRVAGAFCGAVLGPDGKRVPDIHLRLLDEAGAAVADAQADSDGNFLFAALPKGQLQLTVTSLGWASYIGKIEITSSNATVCKHRLSVYPGIGYESCQGAISKRKPPPPE
jgi:Carboxypeptidase regulatory-like domain